MTDTMTNILLAIYVVGWIVASQVVLSCHPRWPLLYCMVGGLLWPVLIPYKLIKLSYRSRTK